MTTTWSKVLGECLTHRNEDFASEYLQRVFASTDNEGL